MCASLLVVAVILGQVLASGPESQPALEDGPPPEVLEAEGVMQGFARALRTSDWQAAAGLCSADVQEAVKKYSSPEAFFREVVPIAQLLATIKTPMYARAANPAKGGAWQMRQLACRVAELEPDPADRWSLMMPREVWWQARLRRDGQSRPFLDFTTVPLSDHVSGRLAELRRVREKLIANESELEPKLQKVRTRLIPLAGRYRAGKPMLFRLELVNGGTATLIYDRSQAGVNGSFSVKTAGGQEATYTGSPAQTAGGQQVLKPGETVVLLDEWDLGEQYRLVEPGRYVVQFRGTVGVAEADPHKVAYFHRPGSRKPATQPAAGRRSGRLFPSNAVEIEVVGEQAAVDRR